MLKAIYPGTFDPFTTGHLDIVQRALKLCNTLIIGVAESQNKKPLFTLEQRIKIIEQCFFTEIKLKKVMVIGFSGLLKATAQEYEISVIIRGLRSSADFEHEIQLAKTNQILMPQVETLFLASKSHHQIISSSLVRELLFFKQNIDDFVPTSVAKSIANFLHN